jgi:hypothetical protein
MCIPLICPDEPVDKSISGVLCERQYVESALKGDVRVAVGTAAPDLAKSYANVASDLASYAQKYADAAALNTPDPPIASIGHSIQFVLAYGGGVSPSWSLIALKGPGLTPPLISGSFNRTHLLQLALGPTGGGTTTPEQERIISNQDLLLSH